MVAARSTPGAVEAPRRVVEETKRIYAELLNKSLDERQLARPSFKFVQEIVKSLIIETRILRQAFNPSDFEQTGDSKLWDKRRRTDFVQRLIDFAANHKQPVVGCVAAKLVAGLEPVKCNELLQALAKIAADQGRRQHLLPGDQKARGGQLRPRTFTRLSGQAAVEASASPRGAHRSVAPRAPNAQTSGNSSATVSRQSSASRRQEESASRPGVASRRVASGSSTGSSGRSPSSSPSKSQQQQQQQRPSIKLELQPQQPPPGPDQVEAGAARAPPAKALVERDRHEDVTSESDMARQVQLLRSNLKQFQRVLANVVQLEEQMRRKLKQQLEV